MRDIIFRGTFQAVMLRGPTVNERQIEYALSIQNCSGAVWGIRETVNNYMEIVVRQHSLENIPRSIVHKNPSGH